MNGASLQAIYRYNVAAHVPIHGEISFSDLAQRYGVQEANLTPIIRFAISFYYVFREPHQGFVAHSAASRKLVEDPLARDTLGYMFDEVWPSFARVCPS